MEHGVSVSEIPTGVVPPVSVFAGLPVYVGLGRVNMGDVTAVNKPVLCSDLAAFVAKFGPISPSDDWGKWTLYEAASAHFVLYGVGPIVCINVIDPTNAAHYAVVTGESHTLDAGGNATLGVYGAPEPTDGILPSTLIVKVSGVTKALGTDYTIAFDASGYLVVSRVTTGTISALATFTADFHYLDPSGVTSSDIIGGYSGGAWKGIEVVEQVFPRTGGLVPGFLLAPTWSETPTVAAALASKAHSIAGAFRAMALVDLSTDSGDIASAEDAPGWKLDNNYTAKDMAACWPLVMNGADRYHASTIAACEAMLTDAANAGIPFASPSNKAIVATSAVLDDGTEVFLTRLQANALNAAGIVTALVNGTAGWVLWGNRAACYPSTTDPKEAFIPVRRMFTWIDNTIILTTANEVDVPINRRLIDSVIDTVQIWLNALVAQGALVGGKIDFRASENTTAQLSDGRIAWHLTAAPPSPAENVVYLVEYDPAMLAALFS